LSFRNDTTTHVIPNRRRRVRNLEPLKTRFLPSVEMTEWEVEMTREVVEMTQWGVEMTELAIIQSSQFKKKKGDE